MSQDYYSVLEINRDASQEEIKRAYRRLAMKYHPDRNNGDKAAEEKFKEVGTAYEVLSNEEKKRIYDQVGHDAYTQHGGAGGPGGPGGMNMDFGDLGDIFGSFFGEQFGGRRRQRPDAPQRGRDLEYNLQLTFEEAIYGTDKEVKFTLDDTCPHCHGSGAEPGSARKTCPRCNGRGQVISSRGFFQMQTTCPQCNGSGTIIDKPCRECGGRTTVRTNRCIKLHVPAGVDTGTRLRSSGNGESGKMGGPAGDLKLIIHVAEHPVFQRDGQDLWCEVPIPFTVAILGGEVEVPTPYGKTTVKIAAGTQNGAEYRVSGQGVQSPTRKNVKGDLHIKVKVEVPTNLSSEQKRILREFEASFSKESQPLWRSFMEKTKQFFDRK